MAGLESSDPRPARRHSERVEEFAEGDRRRARGTGVLVGARVGDDEGLLSRHHGVEEELAILAARIALAGDRRPCKGVVAVGSARAREDAVIEPDETDDAVRDRAHRHHRADRQGAGAEVRARGPPAQVLAQQRVQIRQPKPRRPAPSRSRRVDASELGRELGELPRLVAPHVGEPQDALTQGRDPVGSVLAGPQRRQGAAQAVDELREATGEIDVGAVEVVQGQRRAEVVVITPVERRPDEDPVHAGAPRVLPEVAQLVVTPMLLVQPPAHGDRVDPVVEAVEVVVVEAEAAAHRGRTRQVEHLTAGEATAGQDDETRRELQERIRLPRRPIGQTHPESMCRVSRARQIGRCSCIGGWTDGSRTDGGVGGLPALVASLGGQERAQAEAGVDERREGLDIRTHDEDVARLQTRIVGEEARDDIAQDVDLSGRAVARMDLHRAVARGDDTSRANRVVGLVIGAQIGLEPLQQGRWRARAGLRIEDGEFVGAWWIGQRWIEQSWIERGCIERGCIEQGRVEQVVLRRVRGEGALQLAGVATQAGEERVADHLDAAVLRPGHRSVGDLGRDRGPGGR